MGQWWGALVVPSSCFQPQAGLLLLHCFCNQHVPGHVSPLLGLMVSELLHSCPESVHPAVAGWVVAVAVALLGGPGPIAPECPASRQVLAHLCTLPVLLSAYALIHTCRYSLSAGFFS